MPSSAVSTSSSAPVWRRRPRLATLVNNHEIDGTEPFPVPDLSSLVYDELANGGTTNIEVDKQGQRVRQYVSLAGTHNNCAGGRTPLGHLAHP